MNRNYFILFSAMLGLLVIVMVSLVGIMAAQQPTPAPPTSAPPPAPRDSLVISVAAVGDIMMGSTYPGPVLPPADGSQLFIPLKSELSSTDITIGNLEGPLCDGGQSTKTMIPGRSYAFRTPTAYVKNLVDAGFDVLNFANNHYADFGADGLRETLRTLDSAGLKCTGPIGDIAYLTVKGKQVAVIGFSPHPGTYSLLDIPGAQKIVAGLKRKADIVIVTFHGGSEGTQALHTRDAFENLFGNPRGNVVQFAHAVIDSGADLVVGHGPHVVRALEMYKDRLIDYSLGNFCTYAGMSVVGECGLTLVLKADLDGSGKFLSGRIIPAYQPPPGGPRPDSTARALKLIRDLTSADFPVTGPEIGDDGVIKPKGGGK
jgi:hypothetical protein